MFDSLYSSINSFKGLFISSPPKTLLDEKTKVPLPLIEKTVLNHNTRKFRFGLPSDSHVLGIAPGQHVYLSAQINGKLVVRSYTPVSDCNQLGYVEIIAKIYFRGTHPSFPDGGKMTQHLDQLKVGETVDFRGPTGGLAYKGVGTFHFKKEGKTRTFKKLSMIAGGSGLTPMYQLIAEILRNPSDCTEIRLLFANTEERDIICRIELDNLVTQSGARFALQHILSVHTEEWKGSRGRISEVEIKKALFPPADDNLVLLCGPAPMVNDCCKPNLEKLGYQAENIYSF